MDPVQDLFNKSLRAHKENRLDEAERGYNAILNRNPYDAMLLYLLGNIALQRGNNGIAITLLESAIRLDEKLGGAWNDLGCALKAEHFDDAAAQAWQRSIDIDGETVGTVNNLATLYADSGYPDLALPWIDKALKLDPSNPHVHWNRALALLSKGVWKEGWIEHDWRTKINNHHSVGKRNYAPKWNREEKGLLVVHGEQGLGDEIMFSTCLPDLLAEHPDIILECEPRLVPLFERSFGVLAFPSEQAVKDAGFKADYQIGLADLGKLYRNSDAEFPQTPRVVLTPSPELLDAARELLAPFPKPWIGYSWMGGTKVTRVQHRSLSAKALIELHPGGTAINLQYGEYSDMEGDEAGMTRFGEWTDGSNLEKLAAIVSVLDDLVSVCTTLIHLAGGLGVRARVLTPLRSSWRYGLSSGPGAMRWYPQHVLYRQLEAGDWSPVVHDVKHDLEQAWKRSAETIEI